MDKFNIAGLSIDNLTMAGAVDYVQDMVAANKGGAVYTPNVDHIVTCSKYEQIRKIYTQADLLLADGMPVVWASRLIGPFLKEKISGSDFIIPLLRRCEQKSYRVYFLGSTPETILRAQEKLIASMPNLQIVGHSSPFISDDVGVDEVDSAMRNALTINPEIVIVCLGFPKQEMFIEKARKYLPHTVFLGLGASLDFIAGDAVRAPLWMQKSGLEWAYRLKQEPRRLCKRYARDMLFPVIVLETMINNFFRKKNNA